MPGPDDEAPDPNIRGIRRGRFTVTRLHRRGAQPVRVLVVGSQLALGSPRRHHDAVVLSDRLADRLWLRSRRGVDLDVLWELRPVLRAVRGGLDAWRLWRYDAVIVIAPAFPSGLPARFRMLGVLRLLRSIIRGLAAASHVLVVTLEPAATWSSHARDAMPAFAPGLRIRGRGSALVDAMPIPDDPATGADLIAARLIDVLGDVDSASTTAAERRPEPDEPGRQQAVQDLAVSTDLSDRLRRIAVMARNTFDTEFAEIDIVDRDRQRTIAAAGTPLDDQPRPMSLGARAIETAGVTVIGDAPRSLGRDRTPHVGGRPIRFYAAYPIESVEGYRIGVLCVFDTLPLEEEDVDVGALRELALLAEAELIHDGFSA